MENLILIVLLVLFAILFYPVFYIFSGKYKKRKLNRLKQEGEKVDALITGIHNETIVVKRDIIVCRIYAESLIDQIKYKFISEKLYPKDCKHIQPGDKVEVLIDPQDPKDYYFEFNPENIEF